MRYSLLMHYEEPGSTTSGAPEIPEQQLQEAMAAFDAYASDLDQAGVLVSADVLQPSTSSTTVTRRRGSLEVQDGPFADSREQLAGTFVVDVPDLDAAIAWAEKCPGAQWGVIEVRPSGVTYLDGSWRNAN